MRAACVLLVCALLCAGVDGAGYSVAIFNAIKNLTKDWPTVTDYYNETAAIHRQIGPACHTYADTVLIETELAMAARFGDHSPRALSLMDFWSCKEGSGLQHVNVVPWWNNNGAYLAEDDQPYDLTIAKVCESAWNKGKKSFQNRPPVCCCRRDNSTRHPKGPLDPQKMIRPKSILEDQPHQSVNCPIRTSDNLRAWKNEIRLAELIMAHGPHRVQSSVVSFGGGSAPNHVHTKCVKKGQKSAHGHNYVIVGFDMSHGVRNSYWLLSDSLDTFRDSPTGITYARMFQKCKDGYHPGTWGIADIKATRYCVRNDTRGLCGGNAGCGPAKSVLDGFDDSELYAHDEDNNDEDEDEEGDNIKVECDSEEEEDNNNDNDNDDDYQTLRMVLE